MYVAKFFLLNIYFMRLNKYQYSFNDLFIVKQSLKTEVTHIAQVSKGNLTFVLRKDKKNNLPTFVIFLQQNLYLLWT